MLAFLRAPRAGTAGLLLVAVAVVAVAAAKAWVSDDAYVTLRTVDNLLHGHGPRWNVAERVQTFTHPLWMLLLAVATGTTRDPYHPTMLLGLGATLGALLVLAFGVARSSRGAALALVVLGSSRAFTDYATSGLENPLVHVFVAAFLATACRRGGDVLALCGWTALAGCTRLDALVLLVPPLAAALGSVPRRTAARAMAVGFLPLVAWEAFALAYYGSFLPNSAVAKLDVGFGPWELARRGVDLLANSLRTDPLTLVATAAGAAVPLVQRGSRRDVAVGAGILLHLFYVVRVGGDFMSGRFLTPSLVAAAALLARARWTRRPVLGAAAAALGLALAGLGSPLRPFPTGGSRVDRTIDARGIADERRFYENVTGWRAERDGVRPWPDPGTAFLVSEVRRTWPADEMTALAVQLDLLRDPIPERARSWTHAPVVLGDAVGTLGWYAGPSMHVLDLFGLGDPLLARIPALRQDPFLTLFAPRLVRLGWRPGHFTRRLPAGYFATVLGGENRIADPDLAAYVEDLFLATRAPLLDPRRPAAIARLQRGRFDPRLRAYLQRVAVER